MRKGKYEAEGWRVRKDGSRFWASVLIDPIRSPAGELIGFAKITRDVTERQVAQEALREIITLNPQRVLCLDVASAGNDQLKTNVVLEMKSHGIEFRTI